MNARITHVLQQIYLYTLPSVPAPLGVRGRIRSVGVVDRENDKRLAVYRYRTRIRLRW